ncbi:MAG: type I-B CRISPR-associated protein Cas5 [Clostridia bacterium]|nr:type I-B CRISPR-associated protein Cas5 [Clostridia bacterium]
METLRLKFYAPHAHFRIAQSSSSRRTYPLPPYSTVLGLLANILGDKKIIEKMLSSTFGLGILSRFETLTREYTWMRNFHKEAHLQRFKRVENRKFQEFVEHPGGQSPVTVNVLNDVEIILYLYHPEEEIIDTLLENLDCPHRWQSHLHLGRSEDWAIPVGFKKISLEPSRNPIHFSSSGSYYQWMPEPDIAFVEDSGLLDNFRKLYKHVQGNLTLVTALYTLSEVSWTDKSNRKQTATIRNFDHIPARLFKGSIPFISVTSLPEVYCDPEIQVPVFLAKIDPKKNGG